MFKLRKLVALVSMLLVSSAYAQQATDYSLSLPGWVQGGNTGTAQGPTYTGDGTGVTTATGNKTINCCGPNTWVISPYTGSTMIGLQPGSPTASYSTMTNSLGLSSSSVTALSGEISAQNPSGGGNITNGAWISKNFTFNSPTTFSMYWVYTSTDYVPFNDGSITTLVNTSSATTLGSINGVATQYLLLGATNPGTGNYSTGSYGSTGWQVVNYQVTTAGTYTLGYAAFNQGDTALSPVLFVNDGLGTVTKNGQTFGAVAPNNPSMPSVTTPTTPTVVSTTPGTPIVSSSTSLGTPVTTTSSSRGATTLSSVTFTGVTTSTTSLNDVAARNASTINVTRTTTVTDVTPMRREDTYITPITTVTTTTTPETTDTTTIPTTITTYSDGTTTTTNGTPVTSSDTRDIVVTSTSISNEVIMSPSEWNNVVANSTDATRTASAATLSDALKYNRNNPLVIDALSTVDGVWAVPTLNRVTGAGGSYNISGVQSGYQKTIDNNTFGFAFSATTGKSNNYNNANSDNDGYYGTVYMLSKQPLVWVKGSVGAGWSDYNTDTSIPQFALFNKNKVKQTLFYGDLALYSAESYNGIRPFIGATAITSKIDNISESGSPLLSTLPSDKTWNRVNPYAGLRYEYNKNINFEARATQTQDYKTVVGVKGTVNKNLSDRVKLYATVGHDQGHNYSNTYGMIGLKISF